MLKQCYALATLNFKAGLFRRRPPTEQPGLKVPNVDNAAMQEFLGRVLSAMGIYAFRGHDLIGGLCFAGCRQAMNINGCADYRGRGDDKINDG